MSKRCFLSIDVEKTSHRATLQEIQEKILDHGDHNPVKSRQFHMTLNFFGDISEHEIEIIDSSIRESLREYDEGVFTIGVTGLGVFPKKSYITVVWAGISKNEDKVKNLHGKCTDQLPKRHVDDHDFHPHITLSRVNNLTREEKEDIHEILTRHEDEQFFSLDVQEIKLKESVLEEEGPKYRTLKTYRL